MDIKEKATTPATQSKDTNLKSLKDTIIVLSPNDAIISGAIKQVNVSRNLLDGRIYIGNRLLKESDIHDLAIKCRVSNKSIKEADVYNVIKSSLTPEFDTRVEYLNKLESMPLKTGIISQLFNCISTDGHSADYLERVVKKWFGGIVGALQGNFSVMSLVLVGGQSVGKTLFFRNILPLCLRQYFTEASVVDHKDFYALMTTNIIIYDDEFTSKNKTEVSAYKKISSAKDFTYRAPYGRLNETRKRVAVLCGSANESDVISDRTGNRRIIPLRVKNIDHDMLSKINLNELYRELLELSKTNPTWWYLTTSDIEYLRTESADNVELNEEEELLLRFTIAAPGGHIPATKVLQHICANQFSHKPNIHKLGRALAKLYGASNVKSINGNKIRGYKVALVTEGYRE